MTACYYCGCKNSMDAYGRCVNCGGLERPRSHAYPETPSACPSGFALPRNAAPPPASGLSYAPPSTGSPLAYTRPIAEWSDPERLKALLVAAIKDYSGFDARECGPLTIMTGGYHRPVEVRGVLMSSDGVACQAIGQVVIGLDNALTVYITDLTFSHTADSMQSWR